MHRSTVLEVSRTSSGPNIDSGLNAAGEAGDEELADEFGVVVRVLRDLGWVELDLSHVLGREHSTVEDEEDFVAFFGMGRPVGDEQPADGGLMPSSSETSRAAASLGVSPGWRYPPGMSQPGL